MEPGFPIGTPRWAERLLRLVPTRQRGLLAIAFLMPVLTASMAAVLHFTAAGEPDLKLHGTYLKGFLMYFSVIVMVLIIAIVLWLAIRPDRSDEKRGDQ